MAGPIKIAILADAHNAVKGLQDTGRAAEGAGKKAGKLSGAFGGVKSMLAGGLAIGGIAAVGSVMNDAFAGAKDAAKQTRILDNQIKNLGASGQAAFAGSADFATKLGNSIGVDDDAIKPVLSKLASFPDAFKQGSLGAEGMERATKAAFDLSAIGIGSAESNIVGIGKAMNDPIKGMTALSKSGVSFSAEQKKQITNYVKQGKLGEAQKVLLSGIESNAKGAAEAATTPMQKIQVAMANVAEGLAGRILPSVNKFATYFSDKIVPQVSALADKYGPAIGTAFQAAGTAAGILFKALGNPVVQGFLVAILAIVAAFKIYTAIVTVISAVTKAWAAIQTVMNVVLSANPIGLIVLAIIALIAIIIVVVKYWPQISAAAVKAWDWITKKISVFWNWLKTSVATAIGNVITTFTKIVTFFNSIPGRLIQIGKDIMHGLVSGIQTGIQWVKDKVKALGNLIPDTLKKILGIGSPSRITDGIGQNTVKGLNKGMNKQLPAVKKTVAKLGKTITNMKATPKVDLGRSKTKGALVKTKGATTKTPLVAPQVVERDTMITVNINVPVTADVAGIGRQVVKAIDAYSRQSGKKFLVTAG